MKKYIIQIAVLIAAIVWQTNKIAAQEIYGEEAYKFSKVIDLVKYNYVDTVNIDKLVEKAIISVLKELDPHSVYIAPKDIKKMNERLHGSFDGIGVTYNILNDTVFIIKPIPGGPSESLGIRAGDRIVEVEGETIAGIGINTDGVRKRLMGKKGTKVNVGVRRRGVTNTLYFTITRDKIPIKSIEAAYMIDDEAGYIRLNTFAATSMQEFRDAFETLKRQGLRHLILDLQDNGGGYMSTAEELADEFLDENKLIVYTDGDHSPREDRGAFRTGCFEKGRLVILIDEGSASASEIVSGAVQDWDRGVLIGRRSYGKGLVQKGYSLRDNSVVRLTVARYYTPTGRSIQKPYTTNIKEYRNDIKKRFEHGELTNRDSIHFDDSLKFYTKVNKRVVYGGGGIMPDVFVPLDTTSSPVFYRNVIRKGHLNIYILNYLDNNWEELKQQYEYFDYFNANFQIDSTFLNGLLKYYIQEEGKKEPLSEEQIQKYKNQLTASTDDLKLLSKAILARDIWSTSEYFQVINQSNNIYLEGVNLIQNKNKYRRILNGKD